MKVRLRCGCICRGVLCLRLSLILSPLLFVSSESREISYTPQNNEKEKYPSNPASSWDSYSYNVTNGNETKVVSTQIETQDRFISNSRPIETQPPARKTKSLKDMTATVIGLRIEESSKPVTYDNGVSSILAESASVIRLFGDRFTKHTIIRFVTEIRARGEDCDDLGSTKSFPVSKK
jgi:hypothetical protein